VSEQSKPSVLWSVVGAGLPAVASVVAFINAFATEQLATWIAIGVVMAGVTLFGLQRVYRAFGSA
jgi:hypothetical protein